jgi:hypothetical protein
MSFDAKNPDFLSHKVKVQRGEIDGFFAIWRVFYKGDFKSRFALWIIPKRGVTPLLLFPRLR